MRDQYCWPFKAFLAVEKYLIPRKPRKLARIANFVHNSESADSQNRDRKQGPPVIIINRLI